MKQQINHRKKKKFFVFSPTPHNQLTFYTRCLLQSTTQGFFLNSSSKTDFKKKRGRQITSNTSSAE